MKKEEEIEEEEEAESLVCELFGYRIETDKRQFTVKAPASAKAKKGMPSILGYFSELSGAICAIRDQGEKKAMQGSKTIEVAIERLAVFNIKFNKLLEPLKKLEDQ